MRLTFAGHSTVLIEQAGARLLTDPLLYRRVGHLLRRAEPVAPDVWQDLTAVLISHGHLDHLHTKSLRRIERTVPAIVPTGLGAIVTRAGFRDVTEVDAGDQLTVGNARITAVHAEHEAKRHPFANHSPALGFVVDAGDNGEARAYFAGDTDIFDAMAELATGALAPIDVALIPVWGWGPKLGPGHLDPHAAAQAIGLIRPRVAIPIHWGTLLPAGLAQLRRELLTNPPRAFARFVAQLDLDTEVRVLLPGESTDVEPSARNR
jgi:L-ascorbate metabolism protein UlaG (beta-lactamase superfamily)